MAADHSIVSFGSAGPPDLRLFCFPYAGGSSVAFKGWRDALHRVDVCAIELPGRGRLFGHAALRNLGAVIDYAAEAIERLCDIPFVLYGHSMGAVTALEVGFELARRGKRPRGLVATGSAPPHLPIRRERPLHALSRDELLEALRELETLPEALLRRPDVLDAFLPTIRADMESRETWVSAVRDIKVPITAFGGKDDSHVTADELCAWGRYTSARFSVMQLEGGHFFIKSNQDAFLPLLQDALIRCLSQ
ncbi:thioesterase II family protein [Pendulispora albinea]|uniref:Alpha/beta fold hydrolase n=1 Tax=Pendulispora albinea TaxID=2741071 RepID=A0ABZ2LZ51_9BACT